jgi:hypothetical protein
MTDAVLSTVITTIGSTVTSSIGLLIVFLVRQTHNLVNSRMTEMLAIKDEILKVAVESAKAKGTLEEKESHVRQSEPTTPGPGA